MNESTDPRTGQRSGIANVRVFRDGKLVGVAPEAEGPLAMGTGGRVSIRFPGIRLPQNGKNTFDFSMYAFNQDGVKSQTVTKVYARTTAAESTLGDRVLDFGPKPPARPGQAYLLSIGVNSSVMPRLKLNFAAGDARMLSEQLATELRKSGAHAGVTQTLIVSDTASPNGASKAAIQSAIEKLAAQVRPEDLVILSFSGHGYTDEKGRFYLIPSDAGKGLTSFGSTPNGRLLVHDPARSSTVAEFLAASISSDELSNWLRGVDAAEVV